MRTQVDRPAQPNRQGNFALRMMLIVPLLVLLAGPPVRPVIARPIAAPRLDLNQAGKITLPTGVSDGAFVWGDYDNDGDLDILASGVNINNTGKTTIFVNNGGSFTERSSGMEQVQFSSANWGDYDNDGFLDVLLTGQLRVEGGSTVIGFAGLYHNIASGGGRSFTLKQTFPNIYQGSGTFGDYNNDGHPDILLTGYTDNEVPFSRLYRNTGDYSGTVYVSTSTPAVTQLGASAAAWGDYNRDGFIDFAISGKTADDTPTTLVYRNNSGTSFSVTSLTGLWGGTVNFLDYNMDRYLDLLVTGNTGTNTTPNIHPKTILYRYYTSSPYFREVAGTGLPDLWTSSVSVGDYDNDGYPDLAMGGKTLASLPNQVFRNNNNGTFSDVNAGLPNSAGTILAWGDYNGDNTLDLSLTGIPVYNPGTGQEGYFTYIYPNIPASANAVPSMPVMDAACWNASSQRLTLIWKSAADGSLNANSLTYNLRVGTTENGQNTVSPSSNLSTGYHRLPIMGQHRAYVSMGGMLPGAGTNSATLRNLPEGVYYWSVQAVDASYAGGPFDNTPGRVINLGTEVAVNDSYAVLDSATDVLLDVRSNDVGAGSPLAVYSYTNPSHGTLMRDAANPNMLIYNPSEPYQGTDSFSYYAIRTDSLYCTRATVTITVSQQNDQPTDIALSNNLVPDGAIPGTLVGNLTTTDPDSNQTFTYSLPSVAGTDNASFRIAGSQLLTDTEMNYAAKNTYNIRVRSTDQGGLFVEKNFTILVIVNHAPTDINLTSTSVLERQALGTIVGTLSTTDPDVSDTSFTYTLVSLGDQSYDNSSFNILVNQSGAHLVTNAVFDYNARQAYQVRIRSTDHGGRYFEKVFPITILPSTPTVSTQSTLPVIMSEDGVDNYGKQDAFQLTATAVDAGINEVLSWSISQQAAHGTAGVASGTTTSGQQKQILYTPHAHWNSADGRGNDSFIVRVTDLGGHYAEMLVTVTVNAVNDAPTFNVIEDKILVERSGQQTITVTGIQPGPLYETGQYVTLALQCQYGYTCSPPLTIPTDSSIAVNGTATFSFTVGSGSGTYKLVVAAYDGQSFNNTFSRAFNVTILPGFTSYLPAVLK